MFTFEFDSFLSPLTCSLRFGYSTLKTLCLQNYYPHNFFLWSDSILWGAAMACMIAICRFLVNRMSGTARRWGNYYWAKERRLGSRLEPRHCRLRPRDCFDWGRGSVVVWNVGGILCLGCFGRCSCSNCFRHNSTITTYFPNKQSFLHLFLENHIWIVLTNWRIKNIVEAAWEALVTDLFVYEGGAGYHHRYVDKLGILLCFCKVCGLLFALPYYKAILFHRLIT